MELLPDSAWPPSAFLPAGLCATNMRWRVPDLLVHSANACPEIVNLGDRVLLAVRVCPGVLYLHFQSRPLDIHDDRAAVHAIDTGLALTTASAKEQGRTSLCDVVPW